MSESRKTPAFLIFSAVGLLPFALGFGIKPSVTLEFIYGIRFDTTDLNHFIRAVGGLYFGVAVFLLYGASRRSMADKALAACVVFMLGLAAGRSLSLILDGVTHWRLAVFTVMEIVLGVVALLLYRGQAKSA
jgi:hypothetical protein